jgi:two-component system sensor histidine kinase PhoQ
MSLNKRIILSATIVLVIFITLTAAALDRAFIKSTESSLRDNLTSQLYALMAAAEIENNEVIMPSNELDLLLGLPSSGVYAFVTDATEKILWQSSSAVDATPPAPVSIASGQRHLIKTSVANDDYYTLAYGINWSTDSKDLALTFNITSDLESFNRQISEYRKTLWSWLLGMAALLLLSQALILRWGLLPLRKVGKELNQIELGQQEKIEHAYPQEIEKLTNNINILLQQERDQKTRYRNALGDLAHSLKTPLAVLQSGLSNKPDSSAEEQITRMNAIVEYQLQRAATVGSGGMSKSIAVEPVVKRILASLQKVYLDKNISVSLDIDETITFKGDEGDLMELLGNLLDNAFKWTSSKIIINASNQENIKLLLRISDDGPGIASDQVENLQQRGVRADQNSTGYGIGLSIVKNIIDAYNGELSISKSSLGGAEFSVKL